MSTLNLKIELDGFEESTIEAKVHFKNEELGLLPSRAKTTVEYVIDQLADAANSDEKIIEKTATVELPDDEEKLLAYQKFTDWVIENYPETLDEYRSEQ